MASRRHADITTVVVHEGPDGTTDQLTKGVAADQGRGVFQGRIEVARGADRTDAKMGHHALVLSDHAEVDAKPELEIYADDVVCSHGNTVGALDEEALFYARQRGIPEARARAMLMEAFLGAVADRIEHEGAREIVRAWLAKQTAGLA
jgi:Fe-S cluster assembly protein SufD